MKNPKPKYHFEGIKKDEKGKDIYCVLDFKTGELLEWSEKTYEKNKRFVEK
jgi:hypothetical protein